MIILDTNVLSELTRAQPSAAVLDWADSIHGPDAGTTAVTVAELLYGVARLPDGKRRILLSDAIAQLVDVDLGGRAFPFDRAAASHYASIVRTREEAGRPISVSDAQIAAICLARGATLATRNVRDFDGTGITIINPF